MARIEPVALGHIGKVLTTRAPRRVFSRGGNFDTHVRAKMAVRTDRVPASQQSGKLARSSDEFGRIRASQVIPIYARSDPDLPVGRGSGASQPGVLALDHTRQIRSYLPHRRAGHDVARAPISITHFFGDRHLARRAAAPAPSRANAAVGAQSNRGSRRAFGAERSMPLPWVAQGVLVILSITTPWPGTELAVYEFMELPRSM